MLLENPLHAHDVVRVNKERVNIMQSIPTLLTTAQIDRLLATMAALPSANVTRHPDIVTVTARRKTTGDTVTVFRAATQDGAHWHAMAVPGLIKPV